MAAAHTIDVIPVCDFYHFSKSFIQLAYETDRYSMTKYIHWPIQTVKKE